VKKYRQIRNHSEKITRNSWERLVDKKERNFYLYSAWYENIFNAHLVLALQQFVSFQIEE
jgi:hypothetical protein